MATIYKGETPILGGGYGTVNKANSATTANNANMLSSHPYSSILSRQSTYSAHLNASGWYRAAATTGPTNSYGRTGFLILEQDYTHSYPESYVFAITASYAGNYDITQLVGTRSGGEFTKIRLLLKNNNIAYVDFWYSVSRPCIANVITLGALAAQPIALVNEIPAGYTAYEFATVVGFKALHPNS